MTDLEIFFSIMLWFLSLGGIFGTFRILERGGSHGALMISFLGFSIASIITTALLLGEFLS